LEYEEKESNFGIFCFIDSVKVDLVNYKHKQITNTIVEEGIRMYSTTDIAAMKIQAILGRGRKKDFWDLAELFQHYSLKEIEEFHSKKYPSQQLLISIPQAAIYFADAEDSEDPISLKGQTWESVKKIISQKVNEYLK
jgi:predicted nucleotidyltransferase component of viral defense system